MTHLHRWPLPAVIMAAMALPASAETGVNVPPTVLEHDLSTSAVEHGAMVARMRTLVDIVHRQPAMASLDNFSLRTSISATEVLENVPDATPIAGRALLLVTLPTTGGDEECQSRDGQKASQCGPGLTLYVNNPMEAMGVDYSDAATQLPMAMTSLPSRNGFDVHRIEDKVILTKRRPGRDLFVPVTREQYVDELAAEIEAAIAEVAAVPGFDASELRNQAAGYRAQIAAMSPAERAETACMSDNLQTMFKPCMPADEYLGRLNPAYFDLALGRASVQLVSLAYVEGDGEQTMVIEEALQTLTASDLPLD